MLLNKGRWGSLLQFFEQVMGAGVNRMDLIQVSGKYPPPPGDSDILGVEGNC